MKLTLPKDRKHWPAEFYELWAERAGILEYGANMTRTTAEQLADADIRKVALEGW
jgi:hypothetical protein